MSHSKSSKRWLQEHFNDPYVKLAHEQGYRSRAAFKLLEIQTKTRLIKPGMNIVDLGAAPGSWSQVVVELMKGNGQIFALDILPMDPISGVDYLQGDFREQAVYDALLEKVGQNKIDLVICDISPNTSGIESVDQPRSMYLVELALEFAEQVLAPGGGFLVKVFQGVGFDELIRATRTRFNTVTTRKPKASRPRSREVYLHAKNFEN